MYTDSQVDLNLRQHFRRSREASLSTDQAPNRGGFERMMLPVIVSRHAPRVTYRRGSVRDWELDLRIGTDRFAVLAACCLLPTV